MKKIDKNYFIAKKNITRIISLNKYIYEKTLYKIE